MLPTAQGKGLPCVRTWKSIAYSRNHLAPDADNAVAATRLPICATTRRSCARRTCLQTTNCTALIHTVQLKHALCQVNRSIPES